MTLRLAKFRHYALVEGLSWGQASLGNRTRSRRRMNPKYIGGVSKLG